MESESPEMLIESTPTSSTPEPTAGPGLCGAKTPITTQVTVDGVSGQRQLIPYGTYVECIGEPILHEVGYTFTTHGRLYAFDYAYRQGAAKDLTSEFDLLVQTTVRFAAG